MKNYSIVTTNNIESLIKTVNEMISKGYEPIGGMFLQQGMGNLAYYQTMYKRPHQDPELINQPTMESTHGLPAIETTAVPYPAVVNEIVEPKVDKRRKVK